MCGWAGLGLLTGCQHSETPTDSARIATTTSYLEAAAREVLGDGVTVVPLAEPGTCPGHYDIRPSQLTELRRCQLLLRFDFQSSLDLKYAASGSGRLRVAEVALHGGMCRPESYLSACRQVAEQFVAFDLTTRTNAERGLAAVTARLDTLARQATRRVAEAGLSGRPVIASGHQRDFCQWLGLDVVATFRAADAASIREISDALDAGKLRQVSLVVANLPEGRRTADALAERLNARVVVFGNFPTRRHGRIAFDDLVTGNVEALVQAAAP